MTTQQLEQTVVGGQQMVDRWMIVIALTALIYDSAPVQVGGR